jgi:uncharacterized protein YndB with AHSA1/START domain
MKPTVQVTGRSGVKPTYQVQLKILKPVAEVFDAVVQPEKLSSYFVQSASAPLAQGATVKWGFAEIPGELFDVEVREVVANEHIALEWPAAPGGSPIRVDMAFKPLDDGSTMVQISESGWPADTKGLERSHENAGGWMHMMTCLKAYLEYGINLRAGGAF